MIYLLIINILAFITMKIDKNKAIHHRYRTNEKWLFLLCLAGGSLGIWMGMYLFHHKTKHWYFVWGVPFILLVQLIIIYQLYIHFLLH